MSDEDIVRSIITALLVVMIAIVAQAGFNTILVIGRIEAMEETACTSTDER